MKKSIIKKQIFADIGQNRVSKDVLCKESLNKKTKQTVKILSIE